MVQEVGVNSAVTSGGKNAFCSCWVRFSLIGRALHAENAQAVRRDSDPFSSLEACIDFPTGNAILDLRGLLKVTPTGLHSPALSYRLLDPCLLKPHGRNPLSRRGNDCQERLCRS
jgi:hypothetical protein